MDRVLEGLVELDLGDLSAQHMSYHVDQNLVANDTKLIEEFLIRLSQSSISESSALTDKRLTFVCPSLEVYRCLIEILEPYPTLAS